MSFGLSGKIDGSAGSNKADGTGLGNGREKFACQPFSKSLLMRLLERSPN